MHLSSFLFGVCSIQLVHSSQCRGPQTPDEVARFLWENSSYSLTRRTRPNLSKYLEENPMENASNAEPDIVKLHMKLIAMKDVNEKRGEVEFKVNFAQRWNDYRLKYASAQSCFSDDHREGFSFDDLRNIWVPDIIIGNMASDPVQIASVFWVYPNGDVHYVQSLMLKLSCELDFKQLPKDTQKCRVVLTTWRYDESSVIFDLLEKESNQSDSSREQEKSLEWMIKDVDTKIITTYAALSGKPNSVGIVSVDLERKSSYYMNFVVFPVLMMVAVAWSSFFIDRGAVPARVTMSIVSFLTISNFLSGELKTLPQLGSSEASLLKFMQVSMVFTFYSVLEYVLCNYLCRVKKRVKSLRKLVLDKKEKEEKASLIESKELERAKVTCAKDFVGEHERKIICTVDDQNSAMLKSRDISLYQTIDEESNASKSPLQNGTKTAMTIKQCMLEVGAHHKIDYILLKNDGKPLVSDDHVEIFSRFAFPIAYIFVCFYHWKQL